MKNNFILGVVLILLIIATYFFQEKRVRREHIEAETKGRVIEGEITSLKWKDIAAIKKQGQWWMGDQLLSANIFKQIEKKLRDIKKVKEIQGKKETFFHHPFVIEVNGEDWVIGDFTLDGEGFYFSKGKDLMIAEMGGESTRLTSHADEIAKIKLEELMGLLLKDQNEYKENQLFRFYPQLEPERIYISAEGNLAFEIDFFKNVTLPAPIENIQVHDDLKGKFKSLLTQMNLRKEIPYSEKLKFKKMAEMVFYTGDKTTKWQLWLRSKDSADAVVIDPDKKRAFLMSGGTLKAFFIHIQDFWDKKIIPARNFENFTELKVILTEGKHRGVVTVKNREPLGFDSQTHQLKIENLLQLFQIIFNLGPYDQADRVSLLSQSERKMLLSGEYLRLEVMGQELIIWQKPQELIVANLTQGYKAHFALLQENFRAHFEDMLK
jgi:hypothetical protein